MPHRHVRGPAIIGYEPDSWTVSDCQAMRSVLEKVRSVALPLSSGTTLDEVRTEALAAAEHRYLEELLAAHNGRIDASAQAAGITARQLRKLLGKHGIRKETFKPPRPDRDRPPQPVARKHG